jgi:hypothetical protein
LDQPASVSQETPYKPARVNAGAITLIEVLAVGLGVTPSLLILDYGFVTPIIVVVALVFSFFYVRIRGRDSVASYPPSLSEFLDAAPGAVFYFSTAGLFMLLGYFVIYQMCELLNFVCR